MIHFISAFFLPHAPCPPAGLPAAAKKNDRAPCRFRAVPGWPEVARLEFSVIFQFNGGYVASMLEFVRRLC